MGLTFPLRIDEAVDPELGNCMILFISDSITVPISVIYGKVYISSDKIGQ